MWDAAFPPASPPKWEAVAGYIGGNTPHVWTDQEWARQQARWRLPIFTRSHDGDPSADAAHAIRWMTAHHVPKGVCVALDFETRVDATYLHAFDAAIIRAGWKAMVYGSKQAVLRNPKPSGGYWAAEWTNVPHLVPGTAATQYGSDVTLGTQYDASLVADSTPLWDTHEEDTMALLFDSVDEFKQAVRAAMGLRAAGLHRTSRARFPARWVAGSVPGAISGFSLPWRSSSTGHGQTPRRFPEDAGDLGAHEGVKPAAELVGKPQTTG